MHIQERIAKLIEVVQKDAESKYVTAAFNGERNDGGSGRISDQVKYYNYGRDGVIPPEWDHEYGHLLDDEWTEYQRLKDKFNGK